ncbi:MAG TPA: alpha/beta hydrolase [Smithella sp.]|nr:alpha/beta hydrolase [Smithella sp.]HNY51389.1 alpha/beta hydrolase [Smithella sp.]HOG91462.1 alpha/beta hydrolase [Smithella sp.]HOU50378.1 alpha/beta hydrolase [Smithella sp.]HQG64418.1 alpha/beta hydrolase [Smithella sp.]
MSVRVSSVFILVFILLLLIAGCGTSDSNEELERVGSVFGSDHDYEHITFVNQTTHDLKFAVDITWRPDKHKTVGSHEANYISIAECYDGDGNKKNFEIYFKKIVDGGADEDLSLTAHRKCGENLYIWHEDGEYKISDDPHIEADLSGCDDDDTKPAVLFAHGYNDSQKAWNYFAQQAKEKGWRVFRTSVSQDGSIKKRAHMLNSYINKAAKQCNIHNGSLRVVGHSMGGLDLRYLVSYYDSENFSAAKKIERVYTIATPHQGDSLGNLASAGSDAARDLRPSHMEEFNKRNPYSEFKVDGKQLPFLAIRFYCMRVPYCDGMVGVDNQIYEKDYYSKAPYSMAVYEGKHFPGAICEISVPAELEQKSIIKMILDDEKALDGDNIYSIPQCYYSDTEGARVCR